MAISLARYLDFSTFPESDGAPMAESIENVFQMTDLQFSFRHYLARLGRTDWAVGGNQFLYYNPHNGNDHCAPDVYVALGVRPGLRPAWHTWVEGKCPDIVLEITSPSTAEIDHAEKPALYERLGVQEYYIYDPRRETAPPFVAYLRRGGWLARAPLLPSGGIVSPHLGAELRPVGQYLRVIDPVSGTPLLVPDEVWQAWLDEQQARRQAQERLDQETSVRRAAEMRLVAEERARLAAEDRAASAEERAQDEARARTLAEQGRLAAEVRIAQLEAALRARTIDAQSADQES